jgi:hypothetical protein
MSASCGQIPMSASFRAGREPLCLDWEMRILISRGLRSDLAISKRFQWKSTPSGQLKQPRLTRIRGTQCVSVQPLPKQGLDSVVRDAINDGQLPGPRCLANGQEMVRRGGDLDAGLTAFADGPLEMREVIRYYVNLGVDSIKLIMSRRIPRKEETSV